MPLLSTPSYAPSLPFLRHGHLATILPTLLRRVRDVRYQRERIGTPDGDFLDLGWVKQGAARVAVLSHGLEGSADRAYMQGMARALAHAGWDVLAWSFRGCSGVPNRRLRSYHSGATDDLHTVVQHALAQGYTSAALVGFSLGGNLTLKYLGEQGAALDERLTKAAVFSVPVDLDAGCRRLDGPPGLYRWRFLRSLREKARQKQQAFPGQLPAIDPATITTLRHFDDHVTAPSHGFADAADYYARCSSKQFLSGIRIPTLLVNAADDPFLPDACYPIAEAEASVHVFLEVPRYGGHVGFAAFNANGHFWSEQRAVAFLGASHG